MRTPEQIIRDIEKRAEELKKEASTPEKMYPCKKCRWYSHTGDDGFDWSSRYEEYHTCTHPLVQGHETFGIRIECWKRNGPPMPCGNERALWEEKPLAKARKKFQGLF